MTPANATYQALTAVRSPNQPPSLIVPFVRLWVPAKLAKPIPNMNSVIVRSRSVTATAPVVRSDAMNIRVEKIAHAYTKREIPEGVNVRAGVALSRYQSASQNPPNELNSSAPKVLPVRNYHIPARSWTMPP